MLSKPRGRASVIRDSRGGSFLSRYIRASGSMRSIESARYELCDALLRKEGLLQVLS